jgi:hypothetical protein
MHRCNIGAADDFASVLDVVAMVDAHVVLAAALFVRCHDHDGMGMEVAIRYGDALAVVGAEDRRARLGAPDGAFEAVASVWSPLSNGWRSRAGRPAISSAGCP